MPPNTFDTKSKSRTIKYENIIFIKKMKVFNQKNVIWQDKTDDFRFLKTDTLSR